MLTVNNNCHTRLWVQSRIPSIKAARYPAQLENSKGMRVSAFKYHGIRLIASPAACLKLIGTLVMGFICNLF